MVYALLNFQWGAPTWDTWRENFKERTTKNDTFKSFIEWNDRESKAPSISDREN